MSSNWPKRLQLKLCVLPSNCGRKFFNSTFNWKLLWNRAEKHGADLLSQISELLNSSLGHNDNMNTSTIATMALKSLVTLCRAEVVDLKSVWDILAPKLTRDHRRAVVIGLSRLQHALHLPITPRVVRRDGRQGDAAACMGHNTETISGRRRIQEVKSSHRTSCRSGGGHCQQDGATNELIW